MTKKLSMAIARFAACNSAAEISNEPRINRNEHLDAMSRNVIALTIALLAAALAIVGQHRYPENPLTLGPHMLEISETATAIHG